MKSALRDQILVQLRQHWQSLFAATQESHAAATDPGSKAESKYDTRSLEASYLAAGQARQLADLADQIQRLESSPFPEIQPGAPISLGALVEIDDETHGSLWFLLSPCSGGLTLRDSDGREITLLTSESPLFQNLQGKHVGDSPRSGQWITEVL